MAVSTQSKPHVIDVTTATFEQQVLQQSRQRLVVVDFWAAWCGPCRQLGPVLEKLAAEYRGAFTLAKIDTDREQRLAMTFQIQSIPAVKAFRDGRVVAEFLGAQPEPQIRRWLQGLLGTATPQPEADPLKAATAHESAGRLHEAEQAFRAALRNDPASSGALLGLVRVLLRHDPAAAHEALAGVPEDSKLRAIAQSIIPLVDYVRGADDHAEPSDLETLYRSAAGKIRQGVWEGACDDLLTIVSRSRAFRNDAARLMLLALFALLGDAHPVVQTYRRRLANTLF